MDSIAVDVCEICGTQAADHAGWYAVAGSGATMEILPWSNEVSERSDCRHACCGDHVQKLVFSAATHDLATPMLEVTVRHGGWNPEALVPASNQEEDNADDAIVALLAEVESVLQTRSGDKDKQGAESFDA